MFRSLFGRNGHAAIISTPGQGILGPGATTQAPRDGGRLIVLTAPLTETIDHAGYFIQMALASLPVWMEFVINHKYPTWREVERHPDGTAASMPAGVRLLEQCMRREINEYDVVACYPDDLDKFLGPRTRIVAVTTHNPLGVTFAAGVYTSMFGSSKEPINSRYAKMLFEKVKASPYRQNFKVIVGGSGGWQIRETNTYDALGVDCVVEGRAESPECTELFYRALRGEALPRYASVAHPTDRDAILVPEKRTTFGVVEMTTGCGRRCQFCVPDLNPQIDVPKDKIMAAVRGNVRAGNRQISLATEDMFIWGQVGTGTPFFFPNREALLDLYSDIVSTPGVDRHLLSHATMAPFVVDPALIQKLTGIILDKSPIRLPRSTHPEKRILSPLIGLETGSVRMAKQIMPSKGVPFSIAEWPSVVLEGLRIANQNNWFPMMTLMVGSPGESDEDSKATLDLLYEIERRGLFAILIPSIFTPLHDTRMENQRGVTDTRHLTPLQWQVIMKCWKMDVSSAFHTWWGPFAWRLGALVTWFLKLRRTNGPNFTWPLIMFSGAISEKTLARLGKIYLGKPLKTKSRRELIASLKPHYWQYLRPDNGDLPEGFTPPPRRQEQPEKPPVWA